jgi:hypothetical protein
MNKTWLIETSSEMQLLTMNAINNRETGDGGGEISCRVRDWSFWRLRLELADGQSAITSIPAILELSWLIDGRINMAAKEFRIVKVCFKWSISDFIEMILIIYHIHVPGSLPGCRREKRDRGRQDAR